MKPLFLSTAMAPSIPSTSTFLLALISSLAVFTSCGHVGIDLDGDGGLGLGPKTDTTPPPQPQPDAAVTRPLPDHIDASVVPPVRQPPVKRYPAKDASTPRPIREAGPVISRRRDAMSRSTPDAGALEAGTWPPVILRDASSAGSGSGSASNNMEQDSGTEPERFKDDCNDASCSCPPGHLCNLICDSSPCLPICEPDSECLVLPGLSKVIDVLCSLGSLCKIDAPETDQAEFKCMGGGDCIGVCGVNQTCSMDCQGTGQCVLECQRTSKCSLDCPAGTQCSIRKEDGSETNLTCGGESPRECEGSLLVCEQECPDVRLPRQAEDPP